MFITCNVAEESTKDIWFLDSGCTNHTTENTDLFSCLDDSINMKEKLGNDSVVFVIGKDTIHVLTKNGENKYVPNVYLCLGRNII